MTTPARAAPPAFVPLYLAFAAGYLLSYLYRTVNAVISPELSRELTSDVFLEVWTQAGQVRGEAKISTWVYRVASNLCTDRLRKSRPRGLDDAPEVEDGAVSVVSRLIAADRTRALETALVALPVATSTIQSRRCVSVRRIFLLSGDQVGV